MNTQHLLLNPKGLLTALVAVLLSGHAIAETAGRVNFVVGEVSAISSDGSRRALMKGDLVNSGERLETGKGRLQIRFTDGSFLSLQPNTVFGLDNYTFAKNKPNEGSLLFNFIRGGMRTVSGAIGKVNRTNYKVQTPVATIGIRGTGYAATQEPNGRLLLTVSKGMVNLANDFGNTNVPAGGTFQVLGGEAPKQAVGESVEARSDSPREKPTEDKKDDKKSDTERKDDKKSDTERREIASNQDDNKKPDVAFGDQASADGNPLFESFVQVTNGIPRLSSFGSLLKGTSGTQIYPNVVGLYSSLSKDGKTVGNLVGLIGTAETGGDTEGKLILDTRNDAKSLTFSNVKQINSLSFGEWTNGTAALVNPHLQDNGLTLSSTQFVPYIVGTTAEKNLGNNFKVSYMLADSGSTPVRANSPINTQTGTLTKLNINIDLNLMPLVSVDMALGFDNVNYTAQLVNNPIDVSFDKKFSGFVLSGADHLFFAQSGDSAICANNACPVNLSAFLSSNDMGAVYEIQRGGGLTTIGGVAALSGTERPIVSTIPVLDRVPSTLEGQYTAFFSTNTTQSIPTATNLAAIFDSESGKLLSAFHLNNTNGELAAIDLYEPTRSIDTVAKTDTVAATSSDVGHFNKVLAWGTWSNGAVSLGSTTTTTLAGNARVNYMIGLPTAASALPKTGSVRYSFVGGATPQALFNTTSIVSDTGVVNSNSSSLAVNFNQATAQLALTIGGFTKAESLQSLQLTGSTSLTANSNSLNFNSLSVQALNAAGANICTTSCTGQAMGTFVGAVNPIGITGVSAPQAIGLDYKATGTIEGATKNTGFDVDGTAAFGNPMNEQVVTKPAI
jgi:hypothetical protein